MMARKEHEEKCIEEE